MPVSVNIINFKRYGDKGPFPKQVGRLVFYSDEISEATIIKLVEDGISVDMNSSPVVFKADKPSRQRDWDSEPQRPPMRTDSTDRFRGAPALPTPPTPTDQRLSQYDVPDFP